MTDRTLPADRNPRLTGADPNDLEPSEFHVRSAFSIDDQFVRNVAKVGLIEPPIARRESGELRVIDGVRRSMAAAEAGVGEIPVVVYDVADADALLMSITANHFRKAVTDRDEEAALRTLVGGPRRPFKPFEQDDDLLKAKFELGLVDETDLLMNEIGGASGVGEATCLALVNEFGTHESVLTATIAELQQARGVGPKTAESIRQHLDMLSGSGSYVTVVSDDSASN